jgi:phosphoglycerate dehydrogenase-like enzyme
MVPELNELGVSVTRVPGHGADAIGEFAFALGVLLLRNVPLYASQLREVPPQWQKGGRMHLAGTEATCGIIGFGHSGQALARLIRRCDGRVLVYNRTWPPAMWYYDQLQDVECAKSIDDLCSRCDVVSIHLALTDETRRAIGERAFAAMERCGRSPVLINTARGDIVDENALLQALDCNVVSGAALDVWSSERQETSPVVDALRHHPRVLATPHIASSTSDARTRTLERCVRNVVAVLEARALDVDEILGTPLFGNTRRRIRDAHCSISEDNVVPDGNGE